MRFITLSVFAALLSVPAFAADLGTYRPGTPYNSVVAPGADVCDNQCAGDAQCRGWNYVKPNPKAPGICEFLSTVSSPISSQISISGESLSATPFSSRLSAGPTNTTRVGTQSASRMNTIRVGQTPNTRRIVRQAPAQRPAPQTASTQPVENMSLTAQQNRYRQAQGAAPVTSSQQQAALPQSSLQRPMFRPILDAPAEQNRPPQMRQPQMQAPRPQHSRRMTGPRRLQGQGQIQGSPTPQFQDPRAMMQQRQNASRPQAPVAQQGYSRPPIGQPIQAAPRPQRPQPTTPGQRLAQLAARTNAQGHNVQIPATGPSALNPQQAKKSLFGRLNDDVAPASQTGVAVPTRPVTEQALGEVLAGGL